MPEITTAPAALMPQSVAEEMQHMLDETRSSITSHLAHQLTLQRQLAEYSARYTEASDRFEELCGFLDASGQHAMAQEARAKLAERDAAIRAEAAAEDRRRRTITAPRKPAT